VPTPIRPYGPSDRDAVVELSLRAWAPVFESLAEVLGPAIFGRLHPDWREDQRRAVSEVLEANGERTWVATTGSEVVGFVALSFHERQSIGEIVMIAVDPDAQALGIGTKLTDWALERIAESGATVAMVETGGDPGHAPARRTYEKSGLTPLPVVRYFKAL
jgi:ribosomal protein S18 acetylase RimI-like enzyme